jgi:hypothetical protein
VHLDRSLRCLPYLPGQSRYLERTCCVAQREVPVVHSAVAKKVGSLPKGYHGTLNTPDNNQEKGPGKRKRAAQKGKGRKDKKKRRYPVTHYSLLCPLSRHRLTKARSSPLCAGLSGKWNEIIILLGGDNSFGHGRKKKLKFLSSLSL